MKFSRQGSPDVIHDNMFLPKDVRLKAISNSRVAVRPPHAFQERAASSMVGQLRFLLLHLQEFIVTTQQAALFYSAATLQPRLKDLVLKEFMEPCTAVTMMGTQAAMAAAQALHLNSYAKTPDKCDHTTGAGSRTYAAGGQRVRICDTCGMRWALTVKGEALEAMPKAGPSAKTPLGLTDAKKKKIAQAKGKPTARDTAASRGDLSDESWSRLSASSQGPSSMWFSRRSSQR